MENKIAEKRWGKTMRDLEGHRIEAFAVMLTVVIIVLAVRHLIDLASMHMG